jgi:pyridinium-3,5-biscarboxylic acid mononucleotide synthase
VTGSGAVDLGFARVDVGREARQGLPEVIYGTGKTAGQIASIAATLLRHNDGPVLATRVDADVAAEVLSAVRAGAGDVAVVAACREGRASSALGAGGVPVGAAGDEGQTSSELSAVRATTSDTPITAHAEEAPAAPASSTWPDGTYDPAARLLVWRPAPPTAFTVVVAAAGTADHPVAAEAAAIATAVGLEVTTVTDVGVAGLHRLLAEQDRLRGADTVIVVAGMEGALASAIGGLVACPVVAVPTSTGYGAGLEGITALLAMHASCAAGITVVNIDSGFGAAMAAFRLSRVANRSKP